MWVRGLKQNELDAANEEDTSHPMWVRGLKHSWRTVNDDVIEVAPHVGAWIETITREPLALIPTVAPHVGAWIETGRTLANRRIITSHPMWVRGLKLTHLPYPSNLVCRTPCGCVD